MQTTIATFDNTADGGLTSSSTESDDCALRRRREPAPTTEEGTMAKKTKKTATAKKSSRTVVAHTFPPAGATLVGRYHSEEHRATVVEQDGELRVRLAKDTYRSLSAAAHAITGSAINGWRFWSVV